MHQNEELPEEIKPKLDEALSRRAKGLPIAYITAPWGENEFENTDTDLLKGFCEELDVPLDIIDTDIKEIVFDIRKETNPCSSFRPLQP